MDKESKLGLMQIECEIKMCELKIANLLSEKPLWFQKRKLKQWNIEFNKLKDEFCSLYSKLATECCYVFNKDGDFDGCSVFC